MKLQINSFQLKDQLSSYQLACKESEIADEFRKVFFEGKHLSTQKFDEDHFEYVKRENSHNSIYNEHNDDLFEGEITISELKQALKELPPTGSFDIDNLHILILKHLGSRAKLAVLQQAVYSTNAGPRASGLGTYLRLSSSENQTKNPTPNVLVSDH